MKKRILVLALSLIASIPQIARSQYWQLGQPTSNIQTSPGISKAGIGVNPTTSLDVFGSHVSGLGILRASSTDHALLMANAASGNYEAGLRLANNGVVMWDLAQNENGNGNSLTFSNGSNDLFRMLRSNGYLGLGVNNTPIVPLDISGSHVSGQGILRVTSTDHALIVANTAPGAFESGLRLSANNTVMWDIAQNEAGSGNNLAFSNGTNRWVTVLRSNGYVGIGANVTPGVALDVSGAHVNGQGIVRASSVNHALIVANAGTSAYESGLRLSSNNTVMWDIAQNESSNGNDLTFSNGVNRCVSISHSTGNVGMGTVPSGFKLDVNGTANISGALTVASVNTKVWSVAPDYVFEKGYRLSPLDSVRDFVDKHKHLPEVPSALEMREKGIDLADMNLKLLKKVEELTLYMIDQKKALEEQAREIGELKSKSERLEKLAGLR